MSWGQTLFLKKVIDGKKGLVASDNLYLNIITSTITFKTNIITDIFKAQAKGSVRLKFVASTGSTFSLDLVVCINGIETDFATTISVGQQREYSLDVSGINRGDIISFKIVGNGSLPVAIYSMGVYADIKDLSAIDILYKE